MPETGQKVKLAFTAIVNETKQIPKPTIQYKNDGWLSIGDNNKWFNYLYDLYTNSSQMSSIVKTMVDYITGDEIVNNTRLRNTVNRKGDTMGDIIEKLTFDYCIYGGFAFQIVRDKVGQIAEINNIDFRIVRVNEDEDRVYLNNGWKYNIAKRGVQTRVYERFNPIAKQPNSIFYYKGHLSYEPYPMPMYMGALTSLEISTQIANYHLHNILNNFTPNAIINFNSGSNLPEDVMREAEEKIYDKFAGTDNAGNFLLSFNDDNEHATTIERLQDDGYDKKYETLKESVKSDIYSAFRINEVLVGLNKQTGFSKTEFSEAFTLYNKTVIKPLQQDIVKALNSVFGENSIEIKPFTIDWAEDEQDKDGAVGTNAEVVE